MRLSDLQLRACSRAGTFSGSRQGWQLAPVAAGLVAIPCRSRSIISAATVLRQEYKSQHQSMVATLTQATFTPTSVQKDHSIKCAGLLGLGEIKPRAGLMQADAYSGFNRLYEPGRKPGPIIEAACWAHARRKFFDLARLQKAPIALEAVHRIDALFAIERQINGQKFNSVALDAGRDQQSTATRKIHVNLHGPSFD